MGAFIGNVLRDFGEEIERGEYTSFFDSDFDFDYFNASLNNGKAFFV